MSSEEEKIMAIVDKAAVDALGKRLGRPEGTAHATITVTGDTIDVLVDFDPPSYLPAREPLPPRVPDLCPDDMGFARVDIIKQEQRRAYESAHGPARGCDDCEEERNR